MVFFISATKLTIVYLKYLRTMIPHNHHQCGEMIKLLRNLKGIKQEAAAKILGSTQQYISKLEQCKKNSNQRFNKIIVAFNFTKEDIETAKKFLSPDDV